MKNDYPYLPAHLVQYKDGGLVLAREEATQGVITGSVLIIGTANDGPIGEPVKVDSQTYELFGKCVNDSGAPNGATLTKGFEEAYKFGCRDIRLMRMSGAVASATISGAEKEVSTSKYVDEAIGTAAGNTSAESTFVLDEPVDVVVEVSANGVKLDSTQYTVTTDTTTVTVYKDLDDNTYDDVAEVYDYFGQYVNIDGDDTDGWYEYNTGALVDTTANGTPSLSSKTFVAVKSDNVTVVEVIAEPVSATKVTGVVLENDVCSSGSYVLLKLKIGTETKTVSAGAAGMYIANGEPKQFTLKEMPDDIENVSLYVSGVEYTAKDKVAGTQTPIFTLNGKILTINPGKYAPMRTRIEVRYRNVTKVNKAAVFYLKTAYGGDVYNESRYTVQPGESPGEKIITIIKPETKKAQMTESPLTFSSYDYPTYGLMVQAINADSNNGGLFVASVDNIFENESTSKLNDTTPDGNFFTGGEDGINLSKQEMFHKLAGMRDEDGYLVEEGMFQLLENYSVDNVVLADGMYADDALNGKWQNFAYELALFCAISSFRNHQTHGFIATSSPITSGLKDVRDHMTKLADFTNTFVMRDQAGVPILDSDREEMDIGKFITVIAGPELILTSPSLGQYACNSAAAFAGFIATLDANVFPTNKIMAATSGLKARYSNAQLNLLSYKRYASYKYKDDGRTVAIVDAPTSAKVGSDYARLSTVCSLRTIINDIRETADPFLGQPNTVQSRNALSAALDKTLLKHKEAGTMQDYSFVVVATTMDELLGRAQVELTIVPAQELRQLTTIVSLRPAL